MLVTLHTLLNAIICCFQLNTEWGADANRKVDYLGIDAVGLTVYVLYCNARCCVCWDPMNIDTMFNQVVYLSMCS